VAFVGEGRLASASFDGTVKVVDLDTHAVVRSFRHPGEVWDVAANPAAPDLVLSGSRDGTVSICSTTTGEVLTLHRHQGGPAVVACSPDGRLFASTADQQSQPAEVKLWEAATRREVRTLRGPTKRISKLAFSPGGDRLAAASWDKTVWVWDVERGERLWDRPLPGVGFSVAFSPDGRLLAVGGTGKQDGPQVTVWDAATGQEQFTLSPQHTHGAAGVAFSHNGERLATGGAFDTDATVKLWDVKSGREILTLTGGGFGLTFSPKGSRLASAAGDAVRIWDGRELPKSVRAPEPPASQTAGETPHH
jgi:WD40 repeat protein